MFVSYSSSELCLLQLIILYFKILLGDAIVCWRACVLWQGNRIVMTACIMLLLTTFGTYTTALQLSCEVWELIPIYSSGHRGHYVHVWTWRFMESRPTCRRKRKSISRIFVRCRCHGPVFEYQPIRNCRCRDEGVVRNFDLEPKLSCRLIIQVTGN